MTFNNDSSQDERRQVLKDTMHTRAITEANEVGGRFRAVTETTVIGVSPPSYPQLPASSPWAGVDPVPPEAPIDATSCGPSFGVALGEPHEVRAIDAQDVPSPSEPFPLPGGSGDTGGSVAAPFSVDVTRAEPPPFLKKTR